MCVIIGDVHQFIGHCLIPLDTRLILLLVVFIYLGEKKIADLYNCIFPTLIGNKQRVINQQFKQGVREHWAVYYTSPKSLIIMFSYSLA